VLADAIPLQGFHLVAGKRKIAKADRTVELVQLAACRPFDRLKPPRELIVKEPLCLGIPKRADHVCSV
jgi:hypothetical protein